MTFGPSNSFNPFLPPEQDFPQDEKLFREILSSRERLTASIVNIKENAQYELLEIVTGQQWFNSLGTQQSQQPRYGFRTVIDMVALNGSPIPIGVTSLTLTSSTIPVAISEYVTPLPSFGSATDSTGLCYFLNDPNIFFRFNPSTNVITLTNTTGLTLTQCYVVLEYLKS